MKKETRIEVIIVVVLTIILGILIVLTVKSINAGNKINDNFMNNGPGGGQSANISYSAKNEITEDTTINSGDYQCH